MTDSPSLWKASDTRNHRPPLAIAGLFAYNRSLQPFVSVFRPWENAIHDPEPRFLMANRSSLSKKFLCPWEKLRASWSSNNRFRFFWVLFCNSKSFIHNERSRHFMTSLSHNGGPLSQWRAIFAMMGPVRNDEPFRNDEASFAMTSLFFTDWLPNVWCV